MSDLVVPLEAVRPSDIRRAAYQDLKTRLWNKGRTTWDHWGPEIVQAAERLRAFDDEVTPRSDSPAGLITGQGASSGRVSGRARVVAASAALPDLSPGDVLVTENISPRWTPLLAVVHALVLDEGAQGQHAAIIAREYGVPAVIRTVDGTRVTVDGTAGTVECEDAR
jgi:phosphoenolpyruvate synthase/pyruvate phosphate dikinase